MIISFCDSVVYISIYLRLEVLITLPDGEKPGSPLAQSPGSGPIQPHEIVAALPATGIKIGDLMKIFQRRVGEGKDMTEKKEFIKLVKENAAFGQDKLLRPKS